MPLSDPFLWNSSAVLTVAEMRAAEAYAAQHGVSYAAMMQTAGAAVSDAAQRRWSAQPTLVLAGPGNNGGDGFVAAEALRRAGWPVRVAMIEATSPSAEAVAARAAYAGLCEPLTPAALEGASLVIDALFGTGLSRGLSGVAAETVAALGDRPVLAVDLPSGVETDSGAVWAPAVRAAATVTFFRKKSAHLLLPASELCGTVEVAAIGIPDEAVTTPRLVENTPSLWQAALPSLRVAAHKYERGVVLIRGGARMTGAARLAARAAQRVGAGMVILSSPHAAAALYAGALESVIVRDDFEAPWAESVQASPLDALLIGPGLGPAAQGRDEVLAALSVRKPTVLDADGLSLFRAAPHDLFAALHPACVLTPHEGEFQRLFGTLPGDKVARARQAAQTAGCVVLLKGADTVIAAPDGRALINRNAPPWLATAGAGDVLAGLIAGLLASGVDPLGAAAAGAALHGAVATAFGPGLIAEDLVAGVPRFLRCLMSYQP
jgi:NAD(P)H-hydrate epimerase